MAHHYSEDETDYYKILQIPRSATLDDIRKSYKKLAVIYHPDKNAEEHRSAAAEKFKKIAAAYEVLSDPEKRAMYDRYGHVDSASASHHGGRGGDDDDWDFQHAQDIFNLFFRDFGSSSGGGFSRSSFFDDDFFGGGRLGGGGRRDRGSGNRRGGGFHSSFMDDGDDDLFGGRGGFGFGGLGRQFAAMDRMFDDIHSSSFSSNSSGGTWKGGVSRSTSTTTRIENGKRVTKTTTTVKHADGSVETSTNESIEDAPVSSKRYIDIADGADSRRYLDDGRKTDRRLSIGARSSRK